MALGMGGYFVAFGGHFSDYLRVLISHFTNHKKRGSRVVFRQHVS